MTIEEILAEMERKPDLQVLVEWLDERHDLPAYVHYVIARYFAAIEES
jgi:hypothetical protein